MTLSFDHPGILWALLALLPLAGIDLFRLFAKSKKMPFFLIRKSAFSLVFFGLFLACFIIALAAPRWGYGPAEGAARRSADVVIALDVSRSMDICDISDNAQSRLQRGVSVALDTAAGLPEIRFAAALGMGRGVLAVPLTPDGNAVKNFLEAVDGNLMTGRGTSLESLLDAASGAFQDSSPAHRYIILVSDGESLSGSFRAAAERCGRNNIAIIALALGSDAGQPVPGREDLVSSRDYRAMNAAADMTGGFCLDGNRNDPAEQICRYLRSHASPGSAGFNGSENKPRWFIFIVIAILCYGASWLSVHDIRKIKSGFLQ